MVQLYTYRETDRSLNIFIQFTNHRNWLKAAVNETSIKLTRVPHLKRARKSLMEEDTLGHVNRNVLLWFRTSVRVVE